VLVVEYDLKHSLRENVGTYVDRNADPQIGLISYDVVKLLNLFARKRKEQDH
jgi:hypothetical protein